MTSDARRVALVTGCSRPESLGAALCRELLNDGFRVFAKAQHVESLADLQAAGCDVSVFLLRVKGLCEGLRRRVHCVHPLTRQAGLHGVSKAGRLELRGLGVHVMQVDLCECGCLDGRHE